MGPPNGPSRTKQRIHGARRAPYLFRRWIKTGIGPKSSVERFKPNVLNSTRTGTIAIRAAERSAPRRVFC
jgi:hypothetical protein